MTHSTTRNIKKGRERRRHDSLRALPSMPSGLEWGYIGVLVLFSLVYAWLIGSTYGWVEAVVFLGGLYIPLLAILAGWFAVRRSRDG